MPPSVRLHIASHKPLPSNSDALRLVMEATEPLREGEGLRSVAAAVNAAKPAKAAAGEE